MDKKFEILEHTADFKIRGFGRDKKDLFQNALLGMIKALKPEALSEKAEKRVIFWRRY